MRAYRITPAEFADLTIPQIYMIAAEGEPQDQENATSCWAERRALALARAAAEAALEGNGHG